VVCANAEYDPTAANPVMIMDDTMTEPGDTFAVGCNGHGAASGEFIYAVTPDVTGEITVTFASAPVPFTGVVYVRLGCDMASEFVCNEGSSVEYNFPADGDTTYYIVVDGNAGEEGMFTLDVTLAPGM